MEGQSRSGHKDDRGIPTTAGTRRIGARGALSSGDRPRPLHRCTRHLARAAQSCSGAGADSAAFLLHLRRWQARLSPGAAQADPRSGEWCGWLHFNVSHAESLALYALARDRPVGVDLSLPLNLCPRFSPHKSGQRCRSWSNGRNSSTVGRSRKHISRREGSGSASLPSRSPSRHRLAVCSELIA